MQLSRRQALQTAAACSAITTFNSLTLAHEEPNMVDPSPFGFCFNTSTVRGQKLSLDQQVDLVIKAGYDGIEPWIRDIQAYQDRGGSL